ncbi:ferredoxin-NADP reductase [Streptomyces candidus]|uniref:nitric oxide dioxygenase n=2 Tax=Streptomyces candidus TaxID=67283 RepID=A0A7X0HGM1_9ACTN|nr:ferredoxin-NADP reductase [Streptomyces candidus]GHH38420.1 oxidoreductase [Streptomyces candidus]
MMFEARHTMDALTTPAAGNSDAGRESGGNDEAATGEMAGALYAPAALGTSSALSAVDAPVGGPGPDAPPVPVEGPALDGSIGLAASGVPTASASADPERDAPQEREPESGTGPAPDLLHGERSAGRPSTDALRVRRTLAEIEPVADRATSYFYALLFLRHPALRDLFPPAMDTQRDRLFKALLTAAEHMDDPRTLTEYLRQLGSGHRKYGTRAAHYPAVGEALIGALARYAEAVWDQETEAAWVRAYTTISQVMIDAAAESELRSPAWWRAEVVAHDLRTPEVAELTLRPDQPYPFLAGQYTSLETPWWPRIWRHYSFAAAPRADGLLTLHVKAVPAGWVSNALVHRARPGDVLRLGPPAGSMTVDHTTDSGLLCIGGGTGIAPIKALVEDVAQHGERRPMEVFYGARTDDALYDIDTMLRLAKAHPWLSVRPVVDDRARFPDAVRQFGPWMSYDAYLAGPPGMIRSGLHALRTAGIPGSRIRHDSVEELVAAGD